MVSYRADSRAGEKHQTQEWTLLMPAVSELSVACRSPAMVCMVAACCSMYASLTKDRRKSMAVPSSSSWSTSDGRRAYSWKVASLKTSFAPGRSCWQAVRSCLLSACKSSVHILPSVCSPLSRASARVTSWLLDELLRRVVIALARVAGVKYCLALLSPCFLARSSWRERLAFGAVRGIPPGVCSASPVYMIRVAVGADLSLRFRGQCHTAALHLSPSVRALA